MILTLYINLEAQIENINLDQSEKSAIKSVKSVSNLKYIYNQISLFINPVDFLIEI